MSTSLTHALGADARLAPVRSRSLPALVVAGGGGALGSAVLEEVIASRRFSAVRVLVTQALRSTLQGVEPVLLADGDWDSSDDRDPPLHADTGLIVFGQRRHANGREQAFLHPAPEQLASMAAWMHRRGARRLIVVTPHVSASLPQALKQGLNDLDEHAVTRLHFEHVVFVRPARAPSAAGERGWLQRVADAVLGQLRMMTPQSGQPVRGHKVAQFVAELAHRLEASPPGIRVAPPELVWQVAQHSDPGPSVQAWLHGLEMPQAHPRRIRM